MSDNLLNFLIFCLLQAGDGENLRHIETVELHNDGSGLGFGIVGGRSTGVIVKTILPGGVADRVCNIRLLDILNTKN